MYSTKKQRQTTELCEHIRIKNAIFSTGNVDLSMATLLSQHQKAVAVDVVPEKVEKINSRMSSILWMNISRNTLLKRSGS